MKSPLTQNDIVTSRIIFEIGVKSMGFCTTVCKFQDFSVIHFLREINFGAFRSPKTAIFALLDALNFGLKICIFYNFRGLKLTKTQISEALKL